MLLPRRLFGINAAELARVLDRLTQDRERKLATLRQELAKLQLYTAELEQRRDSLHGETDRLESEEARLLTQLTADRKNAEASRQERSAKHTEELAVQELSLATLQRCALRNHSTYEHLLRSLTELISVATLPESEPCQPDPLLLEETKHV